MPLVVMLALALATPALGGAAPPLYPRISPLCRRLRGWDGVRPYPPAASTMHPSPRASRPSSAAATPLGTNVQHMGTWRLLRAMQVDPGVDWARRVAIWAVAQLARWRALHVAAMWLLRRARTPMWPGLGGPAHLSPRDGGRGSSGRRTPTAVTLAAWWHWYTLHALEENVFALGGGTSCRK